MYSNVVYQDSDAILDKLLEFDFHCIQKGLTGKIVVLGGSGILLFMEAMNDAFRPTRDIDVNILSASDLAAFRNMLISNGIDIVGGVSELPPQEDYIVGENLHRIDSDFEAIEVYVPSIEMLACTKLFSKRSKDYADLTESNLLNQCDKEKLLEMVEEYKLYMLNPNDTAINVHELLHFFELRGI